MFRRIVRCSLFLLAFAVACAAPAPTATSVQPTVPSTPTNVPPSPTALNTPTSAPASPTAVPATVAVKPSHADLVKSYEGTKTCTACHPDAAKQVAMSLHYQQQAVPPYLVGWEKGKTAGMMVTY